MVVYLHDTIKSYECVHRLRVGGHTGPVSALDFSVDAKYLRSVSVEAGVSSLSKANSSTGSGATNGESEPPHHRAPLEIKFWNAQTGKVISDGHSSLRTTAWATHTCLVDPLLSGVWPNARTASSSHQNSMPLRSVSVGESNGLVAVVDNSRAFRIFNFPARGFQQRASTVCDSAHASRIAAVGWLPKGDNGMCHVGPARLRGASPLLISLGENDGCLMVWQSQPMRHITDFKPSDLNLDTQEGTKPAIGELENPVLGHERYEGALHRLGIRFQRDLGLVPPAVKLGGFDATDELLASFYRQDLRALLQPLVSWYHGAQFRLSQPQGSTVSGDGGVSTGSSQEDRIWHLSWWKQFARHLASGKSNGAQSGFDVVEWFGVLEVLLQYDLERLETQRLDLRWTKRATLAKNRRAYKPRRLRNQLGKLFKSDSNLQRHVREMLDRRFARQVAYAAQQSKSINTKLRVDEVSSVNENVSTRGTNVVDVVQTKKCTGTVNQPVNSDGRSSVPLTPLFEPNLKATLALVQVLGGYSPFVGKSNMACLASSNRDEELNFGSCELVFFCGKFAVLLDVDTKAQRIYEGKCTSQIALSVCVLVGVRNFLVLVGH